MGNLTTFNVGQKPCGGSRAGANCKAIIFPGTHEILFLVRGSGYGEADFVSPDRIDATWYSVKLQAEITGLGRVLFVAREDIPSTVTIVSNKKGFRRLLLSWMHGGNRRLLRSSSGRRILNSLFGRWLERFTLFLFYPAFADQAMYFEIRVLDANGQTTRTLKSNDPVRFQAQIKAIPPLGVTFLSAEDVDFYDISNNEKIFTLQKESPGKVDLAPGLEILLRNDAVDFENKNFSGVVVVRSMDGATKRISWFLTGLFGATVTSQPQVINTDLSAPLEIPVSGTYEDIATSTGLIFQCFTSEGGQMEAHKIIVFKNYLK